MNLKEEPLLIKYDLRKDVRKRFEALTNIKCHCSSVAELFANPTFEENLAKTGKDIKAPGNHDKVGCMESWCGR